MTLGRVVLDLVEFFFAFSSTIWQKHRDVGRSDFVSNDEVLSLTGLFDVSYIIRKWRLGLFGHVARLRSDVPVNQILRICTKTRDGDRPSQEWRCASGRPPTTWIHQICRDTGVTATEALQLAEDRPFWWTIATVGGFGWSLRVTTTTTWGGVSL